MNCEKFLNKKRKKKHLNKIEKKRKINREIINLKMIFDLQEFFENPLFRADGLKVYPTLVIRGTGLYELWKTGRYRSYHPNTLIDLVARILALVPPWTRIYRVQRDIPMPLVR